jgi:hypothetical protein
VIRRQFTKPNHQGIAMTRLTFVLALGLITFGVFVNMPSNQAVPADSAAQSDKPPERLLRHVVMFKFKSDATKEQIKEVETAFAALPKKIDVIHDFEWGTDNSPEMLSKGFTHCFLVTFKSEEARKTYLPHAAHQEFVTLVKPLVEDVMVIDYWTGPAAK